MDQTWRGTFPAWKWGYLLAGYVRKYQRVCYPVFGDYNKPLRIPMKQPEGMSNFKAIFWSFVIIGSPMCSPGFDAAKGSQANVLVVLQVASFLETCGWWFLTQVFLLLKSVMQIDFHLDRSITWFYAKLPDSAASRFCFCHGSSLGYLGVCRHCWEILCLCEPRRRGRSGSSRIEIFGESGTVHRGQLSWSQSIWILSGLPSYLNKKSYIEM